MGTAERRGKSSGWSVEAFAQICLTSPEDGIDCRTVGVAADWQCLRCLLYLRCLAFCIGMSYMYMKYIVRISALSNLRLFS